MYVMQKGTRLWTVFLTVFSLALLSVISSGAYCPSQFASAEYSFTMTSNDADGDWVLFSQNYTEMSELPDNVFQALPTSPYVVNTTTEYNTTWSSVAFNKTVDATGEMYVSGLYPVGECTYHLFLRLERDDHNMNVYIKGGNTYVNVRLLSNLQMRVQCFYYSDAGVLTGTDAVDMAANDDHSVHVYIDRYPANQTVHVYTNDSSVSWLPFLDREDRLNGYSVPPKQYFKFIMSIGGAGTFGQLHLFKVEQWVPKKFVTVYKDNDEQPFGLDGTHAWDTIDDGLDYLHANSGTGTLWITDQSSWWNDAPTVAALQNLLDNMSWDLGVHYSDGLASLTWAQSIAVMQNEYDNVTAKFGTVPTSWCSYQNNDNYSHAEWAYDNLAMVWRNGPSGIKGEVNIGNLEDTTWPFWMM